MPAPAPSASPDRPTPPELSALKWVRPNGLEAAQRDALLARLQAIPRPPASLQRLLSPEFVAKAGSAELSELVKGEPLIAAKVLSTVNAPFFGLRQPVTGIGQAVTFLGMNTVRNVCLQYMLAEAFKPEHPASQQVFDAIWKASAIGSELCVLLGKRLNLPDQGSLATQVVLGFVGRLATASLVPSDKVGEWFALDRPARAAYEQEIFGLNGTEIGGMLMASWGLPPALTDDVCQVDRVLVTAASHQPPAQMPRLALAYLCSLLGEQLATGRLPSLAAFVPLQDTSAESFHLQGYLGHPALAQLTATLHAPDLQDAVAQMLAPADDAA